MNCKGLTQENCVPPCKYVNGEKRKYCMTSRKKASARVASARVASVKSARVASASVKSASVKSAKECRGLSRENCLEPECKYVNGEKRKYCMNSKKKAIAKAKKASVKASAKTKKVEKPNSEKSNSAKSAKNKIAMFMLKKRHNITSHFLSSVCSDSGVCIAFGKESDKIKSFFNNFDFKFKKKMTELSKGANGIVYEVEYERLNYKAYTIIKTAQKKSSDNLIYEYFVGMFYINTFYKKFSCFLETYNWCLNPTHPTFFNSVDDKLIETSCSTPTNIGIQVEYLKSPKTIKSALGQMNFWANDVLQVLFQIYFPLVCLGNTFTHYDLHYNNVLLYLPVSGHYIYYHYHGKETISFKSQYIAKIIDYGRCYFKTATTNSFDIRKKVCATPECNKTIRCGGDLGYGFLKEPQAKLSESYINSSISNISHDLRLLFYVAQSYKKNEKSIKPLFDDTMVHTFLKNIVYGKKNAVGHVYGTKEVKTKGYPKKTNNITDALLFLSNICSTPHFKKHNDEYYDDPSKKLGDLHIYSDGRNMNFVPTVP